MPFMPRTTRNRARRARARGSQFNPKKKASKRTNTKYKGVSKNFAINMKKYNDINCEKKIIPMSNYLNGPSGSYLGDLPAAELPNAGIVTGALTAVVLQTGGTLTNMNAEMNVDSGQTIAYALGGFELSQGVGAGQLLGKYCKYTSTYLNTNITMDPHLWNNELEDTMDSVLPHQFRIIQVKARRNKMVAQGAQVNDIGEPSIGYNLFLNEQGKPRGIISDIATQDVFTWFVNRQMWTVLKDERFTLAGNVLSRTTTQPLTLGSGVSAYPSQRFKKYWLPKPKTKVRYPFGAVTGTNLEPVDFNYITHTVILCKSTSSGERSSAHWNVQVNGATAFIDE